MSEFGELLDSLFRRAVRSADEDFRRQRLRESLPRHARGDGVAWSARHAAVETVVAIAPELRPRMEEWMRDDDRTGLDDIVVALAELLEQQDAALADQERERLRLSTELDLMRAESLRLALLGDASRHRRRRRRRRRPTAPR